MKSIMKSKKASSDGGTSEASVSIIILVLVLIVGIIIAAIVFAPKIKDFLSNLPGFSTNQTQVRPADSSNQPLELTKSDPCIGYDFYWSSATGEVLPMQITNSLMTNDQIYVAIKFNDDVGNLDIEKAPDNPKYFCSTYEIVVTDESVSPTKDQNINFYEIQKDYSKNILSKNGKIYFLVPFDISGSNHMYSMKILSNKKEIVRIGTYKIIGPTKMDNFKQGIKMALKVLKMVLVN